MYLQLIHFSIRFQSDYNKNGLGFKLSYESKYGDPMMTYRSGMCGGNFTTLNGIFTSPSYPENYPDNSNCIYMIRQPVGNIIVLNFLSMDSGLFYCNGVACSPYFDCPDYLEIRDGQSENSPLLAKICGHEILAPIQSTQHIMWMR